MTDQALIAYRTPASYSEVYLIHLPDLDVFTYAHDAEHATRWPVAEAKRVAAESKLLDARVVTA